jgi:hypothetical protein
MGHRAWGIIAWGMGHGALRKIINPKSQIPNPCIHASMHPKSKMLDILAIL